MAPLLVSLPCQVTQAVAQPALQSDRRKCQSPSRLHWHRMGTRAPEQPAQTGHREGCQLQLPWGHFLPQGTAQIYLSCLCLPPALRQPGWGRVKEAMGVQQGPLQSRGTSQLRDKAARTPGRVGAGDGHPSPGASPAPPSMAMLPRGDSVALMKAS